MDANGGSYEQAKRIEDMMLGELGWLAPIGALLLGAIIAVVLAVALDRRRQGLIGWWVAAAHLAAAGLTVYVWLALGFSETMSGLLVIDGPALVLTGVVGVGGAVCVALARATVGGTDREGEFYAVLAFTSLSAVVVAAAGDAALLAMGIGALGLGTFVLTGYLRGSARGNEASIKFYVFGTVSGAAMVYGLSWWFGLAGSTGLIEIGQVLPGAPTAVVVVSTALVLVGLGYEASLVPFHFWAPDAYDGAPLPVAAYLSVLPKLAGLIAIMRVLATALPGDATAWSTTVAVLAAITMTFGNLAALRQRNVVRLMAYSSIAQSGYLLMGVAAFPHSDQGLPGLLYYALAYAATNLAAFAVVLAVQRERGSVDLDAFRGLGRVHPWWTAAAVLAFLSLLGLPPLSGFFGKLEVFKAALDAGQAWLAAVAVVNTVVSLYYYLRVIAPTVLEAGDGPAGPARAGRSLTGALAVSTAATVGFGIAAEPLLRLVGGARLLTG